MSYEPFSDGGLLIQSGIPVRISETGGQGRWIRVPQPNAGEEGEVLTVQPDLSAAWEPVPTPVLPVVLGQTTTTISNATLRTTNATTLVAAQGSGTVIIPTQYTMLLNYGGTNAFSNSPTYQLRYNGGPAGLSGTAGFTWNVTHSELLIANGIQGGSNVTNLRNLPLTWQLGAALTGNAANNNTLTIVLTYIVITI